MPCVGRPWNLPGRMCPGKNNRPFPSRVSRNCKTMPHLACRKARSNKHWEMHFEYNIEGGDFTRAGYASSQVKKLLKKQGVDTSVIKRTVVAAYEAEVNVVAHAHGGVMYVDLDDRQMRIVLQDTGPGIEDIRQAMEEGYSTASDAVREMGFGAGMGLSNMKKNAHELNIESEVGKGTRVEIIMQIA